MTSLLFQEPVLPPLWMRTIPLTLVMTMLTTTNVRRVAPAARAATMMTTRSRAAAAVTP